MRWNIDGLYTDDHRGEHQAWGSVQLYRNGIIEAVDTGVLSAGEQPDSILGWPFERVLIDAVTRYTEVQKDIGVTLPIAVLVTLTDVKDRWIVPPYQRLSLYRDPPRIDRAIVVLPDVMLTNWDDEIPRLLRPLFDGLWQAGGLPGSLNYDDDGNWIARD